MDFCLRKLVLSAVTVIFAASALAEGTRTWEQSKFDDLSKGTTRGVAIRSAGGLELAPSFTSLATTPSAYIWAIAADDQGNLYAAAGGPARVYRIAPGGQMTVVFEAPELQVQALAVGKNGIIYAATNPDGKVYKIEHKPAAGAEKSAGEKKTSPVDPSWSSSVYFNPDTKYIWNMILDSADNLYIATGDRGEVIRVGAKGDRSVFFTSDEAHIRTLAFDGKNNLIAGSDGSGLVYRIAPDGKAFVLYSAPKKEITALAVDPAGNIYAAGVGEKKTGGPSIPISIMPIPAPGAPQMGGQGAGITISGVTPIAALSTGNFPSPGSGATGGSEIYRISPDGSPVRVWTSREDLVYALTFDAKGQLLAGSGNRGRIFTITGEDAYSDLLKASASQVTAFAKAPNGGIYASTSNLGKVFLLGGSPSAEGSYESDVFDARNFSRWGRVEYRGQGNIELFTRSGNVDNPDRNWSTWEPVDLRKDSAVKGPSGRFIQWKAVLHAGTPAPVLNSVTLNYLPKNVAPDFDDVTVQKATRYQPVPKVPGADASAAANPGQPRFEMPVPSTHDRDAIGVKWNFHDDNDDDMVYAIYYRGDGATRWLLLKDNLNAKFYSFDAALIPDGGYTVKIVASDSPSHSPGEGLSSERESDRFEVDSTPPQISALTASVEAGQIHVAFQANDSFSPILRAEYSIDAGDWQFVEPTGQLSDSKTENYDFRVTTPSNVNGKNDNLEHVVVVRAYDRYENMSSAKTVIRAK